MAWPEVERRLAAILAADVAGYTRLMADNERATIATISDYRQRIRGHIEGHGGRVVDMAGDSVLAVFTSVSGALAAAVAAQHEFSNLNAELPEPRRMHFRIGVNLGDIYEANDGTIYGEGVNIASRLEGLAEPGGVMLSEAVHLQVRHMPDLCFTDAGMHEVKNVEEPLRAWRLATTTTASAPELVGPSALLADKPSIAVLPFDNFSSDSKQEFLCDAIAEDLITALSKISGLLVISRHSSFSYKEKSAPIKTIARELGVLYLLEGSIQFSGNRIRVNAQLIDGKTSHHIWAERYDRAGDDLFSIQDDIVLNILSACRVKFIEGEQANLTRDRGGGANLSAYELFWRAVEKYRKFTKADNEAARVLLENCIDIDGETSGRFHMLGMTHMMDARCLWSDSYEASLASAYELAVRAVDYDKTNGYPNSLLALIAQMRGEHKKAVMHAKKAVTLEPSGIDAIYILGLVLNYAGYPQQAESTIHQAMRLSPHYPTYYLYQVGISQYLLGKYDAAIATFKNCAKRNPESRANYVWLATVCAEDGKDGDARKFADEAIHLDANLSIESWISSEPFSHDKIGRRIADALRKSGMPDK